MKKISYCAIAILLLWCCSMVMADQPTTSNSAPQQVVVDQAKTPADPTIANTAPYDTEALAKRQQLREGKVNVIPPPPDQNVILQGGDNVGNATVIPSLPYSDFGTTAGFLNDYDSNLSPCYATSNSPDVVYSFTPTASVVADLTLCVGTTNYDTKMFIFQNTVGNVVACHDDDCSAPLYANWVSAIPGFNFQVGNTYYIVIDGYGGASGNYTLDITPAGACTPDFTVTAPGSWTGTTVGAGDDCNLRAGEDHIYEVIIPYEADWELGFCGGPVSWDAYMYLGTLCCSGDLGSNDDGCTGANEMMPVLVQHLVAGTYYVDFEPYSSGYTGAYTFSVSEVLPCILTCPPGGIPENEPDCGDEYVDTYNGGCNSSPYVFQPYTFGDVMCGESGTFLFTGSQYRDTDWYTVTTTETGTINWDVVAEFPVLAFIISDPTGTCVLSYLAQGTADRCDTLHLEATLAPPGIYYLWVGPSVFTGVPCPQDYIAWGTFEPSVPCILTCPPGGIPENEPDCGDEYVDTYNGGCNSSPYVFQPYTFGDVMCGESGTFLFTGSQYRDTDWYTVTTTELGVINWDVVAEFPVLAFILSDPTGNCVLSYLAQGTANPCDTIHLEALAPAGIYYLWVGPSVFSGWPCPQDYIAWGTLEPPPPCIPDVQITAPGTWAGTTCGMGDEWTNTCLGSYGLGEDYVYEVIIPTDMAVDITLDPLGTTWTGVAIATDCQMLSCLGVSTNASGTPHSIPPLTLTAGTYYIMVDTWPTPDCIPSYNLSIAYLPMPVFGVNPPAVAGQADVGGTDSELLTVSNAGDADLAAGVSISINPPAVLSTLPRAGDNPTASLRLNVAEKVPGNVIAPAPDPNVILQGGDNIGTATPITILPYNDAGTTSGYTDDYNEVCPYTSTGAPDVVYSYVATVDTALMITLCNGSLYDTKLYVYENAVGNVVGCNDDACPGYVSELSAAYNAPVPVVAGNTYYIVVDGYSSYDYGSYVIDVEGVPPPPPPPGCPDTGVLLGANPTLPAESWSFLTSDTELGYTVFENYAGVFGTIEEVHFWGLDLICCWSECDEDPADFEIAFYQDAGGIPGTQVGLYNVTISPVPVALFGGAYTQKAYVATLTPPMVLSSGWFSIKNTTIDGCSFLWQNSFFGTDGNSLQYDGITYGQTYEDLAFCFIGTYQAPWLSTDVTSIFVTPGGTAPVNVGMDAADLTAGTYTGSVIFNTNELGATIHTIPVTFNVGGAGACVYVPGDINSNGSGNGIDVTYGVSYLKGGTPPPDTCFDCPNPGAFLLAAMDVNGNCMANGIDITYFVAYLKGLQPALLYCDQCPPARMAAPGQGQDRPAIVPLKKAVSNQQ